MNVTFNSRQTLHLSVAPSIKSWSLLFGILSIGVGAAYYSPDDHPLMKLAYLSGCFIVGLTFLNDWEDCVFDQIEKKITLTRRNWFEYLTSRCPPSKTLVLDTSSVMEVQVIPVKKNLFKVSLLLRSGSIIPVSETSSSIKSEEEAIGKCIRQILCLDRIETVRELWDDSDDDNQSVITVPDVETLERSPFLRCMDFKVENENLNPLHEESDSNISDSSSSPEFDEW